VTMNDFLTPSATLRTFENTPSSEVTSRMLFEYADALRLVGRKNDAAAVYSALVSDDRVPESKRWLVPLFMGQTFMEMGKWSLAESSFRIACELNSTTTSPFVFLGASLTAQEKFNDAISVLKSALDIEGDQDEVLVNLAFNMRAIACYEEAADFATRALQIDSGTREAKELLADLQSI
jgi:Flp pilus assembly protein TadD